MDYETKLRDMVDRDAIWSTLLRCARGMDRHDVDLMMSAYHDDAVDDHGTFFGSGAEFIEFVNGSAGKVGRHEALFTDHLHLLTNHSCEIDGDVAHAETYVTLIGNHRSAASIGLIAARYIDRLEKRDGEWKIALRRVVMGPVAELPAGNGGSPEKLAHFTFGTWDRTDLSYARPLRDRYASEQGLAGSQNAS